MPRSGHNVGEYLAAYGCARALTAAVVAVTDIAQNLDRRCPPQLCVAGIMSTTSLVIRTECGIPQWTGYSSVLAKPVIQFII